MKTELSERFKAAVAFLLNKRLARSQREIANKLGVRDSTISMAMSGEREPTWDLLLSLCDHYPINFWFLRSGEGSIYREDCACLFARINELESALKDAKNL